MLNELLLERALRWLAQHKGESQLLGARRDFEAETGAIAEGSVDYESRIAHFFEQYLCEDAPNGAPIAEFAAGEACLSDQERRELAGWLRSHRGLFRFEGWDDHQSSGHVSDLVLGGRFRVTAKAGDRQLAVGDLFDGRIVAVAERFWLSPGRVFHPRAAQGALEALCAGRRFRAASSRSVLNGLLRMRARFFQFESIRAEHVYRLDALDEPTFAAPWARPSSRPSA